MLRDKRGLGNMCQARRIGTGYGCESYIDGGEKVDMFKSCLRGMS